MSAQFFTKLKRRNVYKVAAALNAWRLFFTRVTLTTDGKRFVVRVDEKLTGFVQLEPAICACGEFT
jgi:hypothetical protein